MLKGPAGQQSAVDLALANAQALQAQVLGAEAQLQQAKINLDYTEIRAPIDGKIGRTAVTAGNYVGPNTGVLVSIVSPGPDVRGLPGADPYRGRAAGKQRREALR